MPSDDEKIKYLITDNKGDFVIELPPTWKITFAAVNPGSQMSRQDGYCVRVWETKDKLRAVFANCRGVRDLSIPLLRKVEKQTGTATWTSDSLGNFDGQQKREVDTEFVLEAGE